MEGKQLGGDCVEMSKFGREEVKKWGNGTRGMGVGGNNTAVWKAGFKQVRKRGNIKPRYKSTEIAWKLRNEMNTGCFSGTYWLLIPRRDCIKRSAQKSTCVVLRYFSFPVLPLVVSFSLCHTHLVTGNNILYLVRRFCIYFIFCYIAFFL